MSISFYRHEAEKPSQVLYIPKNDGARDLCDLMGKPVIRGENAMDQIYSFCDNNNIKLDFFETMNPAYDDDRYDVEYDY